MFKDGAMVVPGGLAIHSETKYVKLSALGQTFDLATLVGTEIVSGTIKAKIIHAVDTDGSDPVTLYLNYTSGNSDFISGNTLTATGFTGTVGII